MFFKKALFAFTTVAALVAAAPAGTVPDTPAVPPAAGSNPSTQAVIAGSITFYDGNFGIGNSYTETLDSDQCYRMPSPPYDAQIDWNDRAISYQLFGRVRCVVYEHYQCNRGNDNPQGLSAVINPYINIFGQNRPNNLDFRLQRKISSWQCFAA